MDILTSEAFTQWIEDAQQGSTPTGSEYFEVLARVINNFNFADGAEATETISWIRERQLGLGPANSEILGIQILQTIKALCFERAEIRFDGCSTRLMATDNHNFIGTEIIGNEIKLVIA